ncbi:MAG: capsular polysaccharide biosynthesis protein [Oscillospiraceae bacterium]|nr:capsular polysaccharide biosynthesis protein [Oscillospiraceae bacterium]
MNTRISRQNANNRFRTDFHSHCLPDMDDGAENLEISLKVLQMCREQGIKKIVASPHYYLHKEKVESFLTRRQIAYDQIISSPEYNSSSLGIDIIKGAEVRLEKDISFTDISPLCIEGTRVLLLELPFVPYSPWMTDEIWNLSQTSQVTPMIAHIDRYIGIYKQKHIDRLLAERYCVYQVNAEALRFKKVIKSVYRMAEEQYQLVIGSDCHNLTVRPPNIPSAHAKLRKSKAGQELVDYMLRCSEELFAKG